jgi:hypothetical protein
MSMEDARRIIALEDRVTALEATLEFVMRVGKVRDPERAAEIAEAIAEVEAPIGAEKPRRGRPPKFVKIGEDADGMKHLMDDDAA